MQNDLYTKTILAVIAILLASLIYRTPPTLEAPPKPAAEAAAHTDLSAVQFVESASYGNYNVFDARTGEYWHLDGTTWTYIGKITRLGAPIVRASSVPGKSPSEK